jgi:hypothetical protein
MSFWDMYDPNEILDEPVLIGRSGEGDGAMLTGRHIVRPGNPRSWRNEGVLGNLSQHRLNLDAVRALDPSDEHLQHLIDVITTEEEFQKLLTEGELKSGRVSRFMSQHVEKLVTMKVASVVDGKAAMIEMPLFTVLKKDGTLRLIVDCRKLNAAMKRPPPMNLPSLHSLIDQLLAARYAAQADGVSYFYQIPLAEQLQKYFGTRVSGGRGRMTHLLLRCLPMGWSWAPAVAQAISNALIRDLGAAWVDNFVITGTSIEDFSEKRTEFLKRVERVGVELDDPALRPVDLLEVVGLEFDLAGKLYRMSPKWVEKASARIDEILTKTAPTAKDTYRIAGNIIWRQFSLKKKLCNFPETLAAMSKISKDISKGNIWWDSPLGITKNLRSEFASFVSILKANEWQTNPTLANTTTVELYSDASDAVEAYVLLEEDILKHIEVFDAKDPTQHIFLKELHIALCAVKGAAQRGHSSIHLNMDNQAAALALGRGASSNYLANRMMTEMLPQNVNLRITWVPTDKMLADPYTRGWPTASLGMTKAELFAELDKFHSAQLVHAEKGPEKANEHLRGEQMETQKQVGEN